MKYDDFNPELLSLCLSFHNVFHVFDGILFMFFVLPSVSSQYK